MIPNCILQISEASTIGSLHDDWWGPWHPDTSVDAHDQVHGGHAQGRSGRTGRWEGGETGRHQGHHTQSRPPFCGLGPEWGRLRWLQGRPCSESKDELELLKFDMLYLEKKEEIWLSPMTKAPIPTEMSKGQRDNTKTSPKSSITQRLWTDSGQSVGVSTVTQLVWLNGLRAQLCHSPQQPIGTR